MEGSSGLGPLFAFGAWVLVGTVIGLAPRRFHWRGAIVLLVTSLPLLFWIGTSAGLGWALGALAGMASILRWPLVFLFNRLRRLVGRGA